MEPQIAKCEHKIPEHNVVAVKHTKIIHKVYGKMSLFVKSTSELLSHDAFHTVLIMVMRDLNKHNLYGFEKKTIAIEVMTLLLQELGLPHVIAHYSAEVIEQQIETVYALGFHRWKRLRKTGCIML